MFYPSWDRRGFNAEVQRRGVGMPELWGRLRLSTPISPSFHYSQSSPLAVNLSQVLFNAPEPMCRRFRAAALAPKICRRRDL